MGTSQVKGQLRRVFILAIPTSYHIPQWAEKENRIAQRLQAPRSTDARLAASPTGASRLNTTDALLASQRNSPVGSAKPITAWPSPVEEESWQSAHRAAATVTTHETRRAERARDAALAEAERAERRAAADRKSVV